MENENDEEQARDSPGDDDERNTLGAVAFQGGTLPEQQRDDENAQSSAEPDDALEAAGPETQDDDDDSTEQQSLDPPASCGEDFRDALLRFLDMKFFQYLGLFVLFMIVADGALFFFLLMGWHALCEPRTDCDPRNWWYNFSIQLLNVLFTYMALVSMPWRCAQFGHVSGWSCPRRSNAIGHDIYGLDTEEIWYHTPKIRRLGITLCLLLNCLTQFANQGTRIKWSDFDSQNTSPGNIWTNVFFAASFLFAGIAGAWMIAEEQLLRRKHPGKFSPSIFEVMREYAERYVPCCKRKDAQDEEVEEAGDDEHHRHLHHHHELPEPVDRVSNPQHEHVVPIERTGMRMWAL